MTVDPRELARQAEEAEKELEYEKPKSGHKTIFLIITAIVLISLIVLFVIPVHNIKVHPNPKKVDKIDFSGNFSETQKLGSVHEINDRPLSKKVRNAAVRIISDSECHGSETCYAKAIYRYVREYYVYVSDPKYDYIQSPEETLLTGGGDCEDLAILLSELLTSVGIHNRIVLVYNHAFNEVWIPDAPRINKNKNGWIELDATCKRCDFGQLAKEYPYRDYVYP